MGEELRYEVIDLNFRDLDKIEELYDNAFPPEERVFTVKQALDRGDKMGTTVIVAVYDGNELVGFYCTKVYADYSYLHYFAVNQNIRSRGYGGRILRKLLEDNKDRVFFGSIEKPVICEDDYEIRMRRKQFYETNGMICVAYEQELNGKKFIVVTNKTGEDFDKCYKKEMKELEAYM